MTALSGMSFEFVDVLHKALTQRQSLRREDVEFELAAVNVVGPRNAVHVFPESAALYQILATGAATIAGAMATAVTEQLRRKAVEVKGGAVSDDVVKRYEARLLRVKAECDALGRAEGFAEEDVQRRRRLLLRELVGGATNA